MVNVECQLGPIERCCPVQCQGTIQGEPFYFRARGHRWTLGVGGDIYLCPNWFYAEPYPKGPYDAGFISDEEAIAFIHQGLERYLSDQLSSEEASNPAYPAA